MHRWQEDKKKKEETGERMIKTQNKNVKISPNISVWCACTGASKVKHQGTSYLDLFLIRLLLLKTDTPKTKHPKIQNKVHHLRCFSQYLIKIRDNYLFPGNTSEQCFLNSSL